MHTHISTHTHTLTTTNQPREEEMDFLNSKTKIEVGWWGEGGWGGVRRVLHCIVESISLINCSFSFLPLNS